MHSLSKVGYTVGGGGVPFSSHCPPSKLSFNPQLHPPYATMPSSTSNWIPANNQYTWRDSNNQAPPHPAIQRNQMRSSNGSDWRRQMMESSHTASTTGPPACMWSQPQPPSLIQSQPFTANTSHWNEHNHGQQGTHGPIDSSNMHALNQYFSIGQQTAGCHVKFDGQGDEPIVYSPGQQRAKGPASNQKSLQHSEHQTTFPGSSRAPQVSVSAMGVEAAPEMQYSYTSATTEAPKLLPPVPTMNRNSPKPCGTCPACTFQTKSSRMPGQPHLVRSPKVQQKIQPTQGRCTMPQMITSLQVQPQSPAQSGDMQMLNFANLLPMQVQQSHQ